MMTEFHKAFALAFILSPESPWLLSDCSDLLGCWIAGGEL